jgi:hypothetical protein
MDELKKDFEELLVDYYHVALSNIWERSGNFNRDISNLNKRVQGLADKHGIEIDYLEEVEES